MATTTATATINNNNLTNNLNHLSNDFKSSLDNYLQYQKGISLLNNRYSFIKNLQTGSFGKVTCAYDILNNNNKVAIKALKKSISGVSLMANHEVSIMKSLGYHKNLIQLLDFFETKKYFILVLEFADSGDLYDAIHNKSNLGLNFQNNHLSFINLCSQLFDVINYCHNKGIYHRDIKPENILLLNDGTIKLCDWGLSTKFLKSNDYNVGTEKYMAPEALIKINENDFYYSNLIDYYSIGITLLFTLFNKCPFRKAINSDPNYCNFLKSKSFIYDFFTNINSISFIGIIDMLIIDRNLNGLKYLIENGLKNGFTIDQEYSINFSNQQNNYINSIIDSFNENNESNDNNENNIINNNNNNINNNNNNNENDVFLFDDYDTLNEDDFINENTLNELNNNNNNNNNQQQQQNNLINDDNLSNYIHNSNVNPIPIQQSSASTILTTSNIAGSIMNSTSTYNSSSLFDSNINNHNSFINSFELNNNNNNNDDDNDVWSQQISDLRFKF
ncbi:Serine/threonine-protein kinase Nek4 [Pichia californica]|uniref:non-specific serine/threonine protein kinase n=1 Tax=Pichia californica TaxID=460514 RepID=A0A9P6WQ49_9ASCO|nr:Serine/threonine-protein kinase Nek4 [[Candida] californica]KAG0691206.1 Serine/threonine-protein kinase Nek4 [[Candida] californica]